MDEITPAPAKGDASPGPATDTTSRIEAARLSISLETRPSRRGPAHSLSSPKPGLLRSLPPAAQANLLGIFSLFYTVVFTVLMRQSRSRSLPGWRYWVVLAVMYALLWLPFHLPRFQGLPKAVNRALYGLGKTLGLAGRGIEVVAPPADAGSLLKPTRVSRSAYSKWPLSEAVRVQGLGIGIITMAGWYTSYSQGPFKSPFGLIFFALPLLSPNLASRSGTILGIYAVTVTEAFLFTGIARHGNLPSDGWFRGTTIGVLGISAFVSWVVRRSDEADARRAPNGEVWERYIQDLGQPSKFRKTSFAVEDAVGEALTVPAVVGLHAGQDGNHVSVYFAAGTFKPGAVARIVAGRPELQHDFGSDEDGFADRLSSSVYVYVDDVLTDAARTTVVALG